MLGLIMCSGGSSVSALADDRSEDGQQVQFNRDIRPILADKCFQYHGPGAAQRQTDLRLDQASGAYADYDGNGAILPRDPAASELVRRISTDDDA
ncbi:MAG: c-type cytochrome domain-containing protein, partial [Fuerstiella sp.]